MRRPTRAPWKNLAVLLFAMVSWFIVVSFAFSFPVVVAAPEPYRLDVGRQASFPVRYWIDSRFTPDENAAIRAAFGTWSIVSDSPVFFVYKGTCEATAPVEDGRVTVVKAMGGQTADGALAEVVRHLAPEGVAGSEVRPYSDTDVVLDFGGRVRWSTTAEPGRQDLQAVVTHEIGHVLGLENVDDTDQVMYRYSVPVDGATGHPARRDLGRGDRMGLRMAYPPQ